MRWCHLLGIRETNRKANAFLWIRNVLKKKMTNHIIAQTGRIHGNHAHDVKKFLKKEPKDAEVKSKRRHSFGLRLKRKLLSPHKIYSQIKCCARKKKWKLNNEANEILENIDNIISDYVAITFIEIHYKKRWALWIFIY